MPPIRTVTDHRAVSSTLNRAKSALLIDFGQNMAGFATLTLGSPPTLSASAIAASGPIRERASAVVVVLRLRYTEILDAAGESENNFFPGMEFNHTLVCAQVVRVRESNGRVCV